MKQEQFFIALKDKGYSKEEALKLHDEFVSKGGSFDDEQPDPVAKEQPKEEGFGAKTLRGLGKTFETIDRFTGAPVRAGLNASLEAIDGGSLTDIVTKPINVVMGKEKAPSGADIVKGSYGENAYNNSKVLKGLGGITEMALDPTNLIGGGAVKGAGNLVARGLGKSGKAGELLLTGGKMLGEGADKIKNIGKNAVKTGLGGLESFGKGMLAKGSGVERPLLEDLSKNGKSAGKTFKELEDITAKGQGLLTDGKDVATIPNAMSRGEEFKTAIDKAREISINKHKSNIEQVLKKGGAGDAELLTKGNSKYNENVLRMSKLIDNKSKLVENFESKKEILMDDLDDYVKKRSESVMKQLKRRGSESDLSENDIIENIINFDKQFAKKSNNLTHFVKSNNQDIKIIDNELDALLINNDSVNKVVGRGENELHGKALAKIEDAVANKKIPEGDVGKAMEIADQIGMIKNGSDLLDRKQEIGKLVKKWKSGQSGLHEFVDNFAKDQYKKIDDALEQHILTKSKDPVLGQHLSDLYKKTNETSTKAIDALGKTGIEASKIAEKSGEDVIKHVDNLKTDDIKKMMEASKNSHELVPIVNKIKENFLDNLILKHVNADHVLNPYGLKKELKVLEESGKAELLIDKKKFETMKEIVDKMETAKRVGYGLSGYGGAVSRSRTGMSQFAPYVMGTLGAGVGGATEGTQGSVGGMILGLLSSSPQMALRGYKTINATKTGLKGMAKGLSKAPLKRGVYQLGKNSIKSDEEE